MPSDSIDCLDRHSLDCLQKYGLTALTKIKKISPLRLPLKGERSAGGWEREMVKNYQKLKKIIISPKCPKTIQKISNIFLIFGSVSAFL